MLEGKGLRKNAEKTKGIQFLYSKKAYVLKVDVCHVSAEPVDCNSIQCTKCQKWVHHHSSDVPQQIILLSYQDVFVCRMCLSHNCSVKEKGEVKTGEDVLRGKKICYLGDMFSSCVGASDVVSAGIGSAWRKFRYLGGILIGK